MKGLAVCCFALLVLLLHLVSVVLAASSDLNSAKLCPRGTYGQSNGYAPCVPCPKGRYGLESGIASSSCSGQCPPGKYGNKFGQTSEEDGCFDCPRNSYASFSGTTSEHCTPCAAGKFHRDRGMTSSTACATCDSGYLDNYCQYEDTLETMGRIN